MNHQPYESLLLREEPLLPSEKEHLDQHLVDCEDCQKLSQSWKMVERQLDQVSMAVPQPGFTSRWKIRLEAERRRSHKRQTVSFIVLGMVGLVVLSLVILVSTLPWIQSPSLLFWTYLEQMISLAFFIDVIRDSGLLIFYAVGSQLIDSTWLISYLPLGVILIAGLGCEIIVLWYVSIKWLTRPIRIPA